MNSFKSLYTSLLRESDDFKKMGIFPGAFKPPHIGHFETAKIACSWATGGNKQPGSFFIFASGKSRSLDQQNVSGKDAKDCDGARYNNLLADEVPESRGSRNMVRNFRTDNLLSIQSATCARLGSASAVRTALREQDRGGVESMLPKELDQTQRDQIWKVLTPSIEPGGEKFGHIDAEQMTFIWRIYIDTLQSLFSKCDIEFDLAPGSPVTDTYELVDAINKGELGSPENISINLYVGG